jgi:DNA-binding CsgD family transcriptional regulator
MEKYGSDIVILFDASSRIVWISRVHDRFGQSPGSVAGLSILERVDNAAEVEAAFSDCLMHRNVTKCEVVITQGDPKVTQRFMTHFVPLDTSTPVAVVGMSAEIPDELELLTPRELEVLRLVADDRSTNDIAKSLHITVSTVETHIRNMKSKLRCQGIAGLVRFALQAGLTD